MVQKNLLQTMIFLGLLVCLPFFASNRLVQSAGVPAPQTGPTDPTFEKTVQPFFANHCYACHNDERQTGGLSLEIFQTATSLSKDRVTMKLILDKLNAGAMPPAKMPRPKPEDVRVVTQWISNLLATEPGRSAAPGNAAKPAELT